MLAASDGFSRVVKVLLSRGANVAIEGDYGFTALLLAASDGYLDVCKMLVKAGSDLEVATATMGSTPLHLAGEGGNVELMRVFLEAGANVDTRRPDGASVLFTASEKGHLDAVRELLRSKANALLFRTDRQTGATYVPLDTAAQNGHSGVARELVRRRGIEGCGGESGGVNALRLAARGQHLDIMSALTDAGVVDTGEALSNAAECGREGSVLFLLRQRRRQGGALILRNARTAGAGTPYVETNDSLTGTTPLFMCIAFCASNAPRVARLLIDAGADTTSAVRIRHVPGASDTPLALTERYLSARNVNGRPATAEQMCKLEAIRRLLLQVPAVRAVSWLWPVDANADAPAPAAVSPAAGGGCGRGCRSHGEPAGVDVADLEAEGSQARTGLGLAFQVGWSVFFFFCNFVGSMSRLAACCWWWRMPLAGSSWWILYLGFCSVSIASPGHRCCCRRRS